MYFLTAFTKHSAFWNSTFSLCTFTKLHFFIMHFFKKLNQTHPNSTNKTQKKKRLSMRWTSTGTKDRRLVVVRRWGRQRRHEAWKSGGCLSQVLALAVVRRPQRRRSRVMMGFGGRWLMGLWWLSVDLWVLAAGGLAWVAFFFFLLFLWFVGSVIKGGHGWWSPA